MLAALSLPYPSSIPPHGCYSRLGVLGSRGRGVDRKRSCVELSRSTTMPWGIRLCCCQWLHDVSHCLHVTSCIDSPFRCLLVVVVMMELAAGGLVRWLQGELSHPATTPWGIELYCCQWLHDVSHCPYFISLIDSPFCCLLVVMMMGANRGRACSLVTRRVESFSHNPLGNWTLLLPVASRYKPLPLFHFSY